MKSVSSLLNKNSALLNNTFFVITPSPYHLDDFSPWFKYKKINGN